MMEQIDKAKVLKTYSGGNGCACGCQGTYAYTERGSKESNPGYAVDVTPGVVTRRVNEINKALADHEDVERIQYLGQAVYEFVRPSGTVVRAYVKTEA